MFDVSFLELAVIAVIALIVLGPERLPTAARTAGLWIGRIKRTVSSVQRDITSQLEAEELQRQVKQQRDKVDQGLSKARQEVERLGDNDRSGASSSSSRSAGTNSESAAAETAADPASSSSDSAPASDTQNASPTSSSDADRDIHSR